MKQISMFQKQNTIIFGDALDSLKLLESDSVDTCITSPPYYNLRDYGKDGQIGLESTPEEYIERLVAVFREVRRVLKPDGTLWVNIADSYAGSGKGRTKDGTAKIETFSKTQSTNAGSINGTLKKTVSENCKPKDLIGIPWMLAFALRADGWYLRQDIIWAKPNPMPESVKDRCTKSHEYIFLLSKSPRYYFDNNAIKEPASYFEDMKRRVRNGHGEWKNKKAASTYAVSGVGRSRESLFSKDGKRNKRDVWTIATKAYKGSHFATFPDTLITPCVLAGCREGGVVLDPFLGSGTTLMVANHHGRNGIGIELNEEYEKLIADRIGEFKKIKIGE